MPRRKGTAAQRISVMLLAAAAAAALTACGQGKESQEKETGSKTEVKSDDVLSVMTWDDNQAKGLQKILDDFTEETGIKAETGVVKWITGMLQIGRAHV